MLAEAMDGLPAVRLTPPPADIGHAYYKYYAFVRTENLRADWSRDRIVAELHARGVPCFTGSCSEIYLEKAFETLPTRPQERLPVAKELGETSLMFIVHPTLSAEWMAEACGVLREVLQRAAV
jgi:dTDP-4-amino-4,6-dideoxygalactose transaminase